MCPAQTRTYDALFLIVPGLLILFPSISSVLTYVLRDFSYFERFCIVRDNLVGTHMSARKPLPVDRREVNFYEFIIYLYLQLIVQPSFGYPYAKGIRRPDPESSSLSSSSSSAASYISPRTAVVGSLSQPSQPLSAREKEPTSARKVAVRRKIHTHEAVSPRANAAMSRLDSSNTSSGEKQGASTEATGATPPSAQSSTASLPSHSSPMPSRIDANADTNASGPYGGKASPRAVKSPRAAGISPPPRSPKTTAANPSEPRRKSTFASSSPNLGASSMISKPSEATDNAPGSNSFRMRLNRTPTSVPLSQQMEFMQEHLGYILRLLCADEPSCNVRRSELEPLNFLLAVAYSNVAVHDLNLIDVLPKANVTEKYSRLDLTEWLLHRLRVNAYLYSMTPSEVRQETFDNAVMSTALSASKNLVKRPISVVGVHQQTVLRADTESLPMRGTIFAPELSAGMHSVESVVDSRFARVKNCNSSYIYMLCAVSCMKVQHCNESIIVVGAVSSLLCVENCKDTTIITACKAIQISNCENCTFYLMTSTPPLLLGNNYGLQFGPYCTHYRSLDRHVTEAGLDSSQNLWNQPILFIVELLREHQPPIVPFGNARYPLKAAISKLEKQAFSLVPPDNFSPFRVPFELHGPTKQIPFPLPSDYQLALEDHTEEAILLKKELDRLIQDKKRQALVQHLVRTHFERWLAETGAMQQIEDLVKLQMQ